MKWEWSQSKKSIKKKAEKRKKKKAEKKKTFENEMWVKIKNIKVRKG